MSRSKPPRTVSRGAIVRLRQGRDGTLTNNRAIVMGYTAPSNYSRAYGREAYVCELFGNSASIAKIASDAIKDGRKADARKIIDEATHITEKGVADLYPVGRVKKIPKICLLAMKIEKGKF